MHRRTFLRGIAVGVSGVVGGCLAAPNRGTEGRAPRPWPRRELLDTADGTHDLFVENLTEQPLDAWIRVVREDGGPVVDDRYELPDERGIRFDDAATWETSYTIDLAVDHAPIESFRWYTASCAGEGGQTTGSRNGSVRVTSAPDSAAGLEVEFVRDECDAIKSPTVPTGPADTFRLTSRT